MVRDCAKSSKFPDMTYHRLGNSGLYVSAIALGSWISYGGHSGDENAFACMKQAYDLGVNFFDTAENYSNGQSELLMGKAIKRFGWKRGDLVISTKVNFGDGTGDNIVNRHGLSRKHIIEGTLASLERLQLDYVDIIFAHRPDRQTPMEEIVKAFNYVIDKGLAFYWGTSMWGADELAEACTVAKSLGLAGPVVEQPQYNMIDREKVEGEYSRVCSKFGIGLTVYSPLKQGILTGKYNSALSSPPADTRFSQREDRAKKEKYGSEDWLLNIEQVRKVQPIADKLGVPMSTLAAAWCLKNENVASIVTGASRPQQVISNVECLKLFPKLSDDVMGQIDAVLGNKPAVEPPRFGGN